VTDPVSISARPAVRRGVTIVLLGVMAALLVSSSLHKRLVYDEYDNLSYGYRFLTKGPGVPPLGQRMPVLALNALGCLADGCDLLTLKRSEGARLAVRAGSMVFAISLALLLSLWAGRMFGPVGRLAALWLAVFDPTLLAHGKQVTSDVGVATCTTAAVYAYWQWRERRSVWSLAACALATAAAIASKFTGLLLVPILALLVTVDLVRGWRSGTRPTTRDVGRGLALAGAFGVAVLGLLNAAYLFNGTFRTASSYQWQSEAFRQHVTWPVPVPLPKVFFQGLDYSSYLQENPDKGRGWNYVLGELNRDGRWYAFPLMVLLKTPLAVFVLALLGLRSPGPPGVGALLAIPFAVVMLFFSLCVDPQIGIRYVLPALPFLILAAARGAANLRGHRRWLVPLLLAWQAISTLSYHPHFIPYFNELIGRRVNAYKYLADSNLDWEDHGYDIEKFLRRHPEMDILIEPARGKPVPGWILVGANGLVGIFMPDRFRWLREGFEPVGHVAYSHLLYYIPPDRVDTLPEATRGKDRSAPDQ
jgi:dolichyl-phosphate-mannose-protein mannosyltransferase